MGDSGSTFAGLSGKIKEDFGHGDAEFVIYMNVFSNSIASADGTEHIEIDINQNEVKYGDVFFTTSSETPEEVGMSSVWLENTENVYLNSFCFGYRPAVEFDPYYLAFMLRSPSVRKKFMFLAQGISRYNISKNKVMKMNVPVPSVEEQQKIGAFFKQLDHTIALHQRKLDKLQELKKAFLDLIFSQKLRFEGFEGEWECRQLGDVANIIGGGTPNTDRPEYWDGHIDWYSPTEIGEQIYVSKSKKKISELGLKKSSAQILPIGTVLFTSRAGIGNTAILLKQGATSQGFQSIVPHENILDSYFVFSQTNALKRYGETKGAGSTFREISGKQMSKMPISIPTIKEQREIGDFSKNIDEIIALYKNYIEKLKDLKKDFLQTMFIR